MYVFTIPKGFCRRGCCGLHIFRSSAAQNPNSPHTKSSALAAVVVLIMVALSGRQSYGVAGPAFVESENLSSQIEQSVKELEYSDKTARDFVSMVNGWKDKQDKNALAVLKEKLSEAKEAYKQDKISQTQLTKIEEGITGELGQKIQKEITFNDKFFDLADIIKHRQSQCLGYTQLFYILGNSVGLSVQTINIAELRTGTLPPGSAHTASIVTLSDGRTVIVDLVTGGFISTPFVLTEQFTKAGNYWELRDKNNPLKIDRKIQTLDKNGLIAYIYNNRANIYSGQGQHTQAISILAKAIEHHPKYAEAYYNRGIIYRNLGQLQEALSDYNLAIEHNPNFTEAYTNRGIVHSTLGRIEQAIADYDRAIKLNPNIAETYYNRGIAYDKSGQFDKAVSDYDRSIELNANFPKAYSNRGVSYALLGKTEEARKDLLKAAELNPALKAHVKMVSDRFKLNANPDGSFSSAVN